jgi:hypothetical protein
VSTAAMIECMRKLYDSNELANEIEGVTAAQDQQPVKETMKPIKVVRKKK